MRTLYPNLPGVFIEDVDGRLVITPEGKNHVIGVFGTTESGPAYLPSVVTDFQSTTQLFGAYGTAIQGIFEAMQGNPETISVTRIGGVQTQLILGNGLLKMTLREPGPNFAKYYGIAIFVDHDGANYLPDSSANYYRVYDLTKTDENGNYILVYSSKIEEQDQFIGKTDVFVEVDDWVAFFTAAANSGILDATTHTFGTESAPVSIKEIYDTHMHNNTFFFVALGKNGATDMKLTAMKLMESMLKGFNAAMSSNMDQVFVPGAYLDNPNIADDERLHTVYIYNDGTAVTVEGGDTFKVVIDADNQWEITVTTETTISEVYNTMAQLIDGTAMFEATTGTDTIGSFTGPYLKITAASKGIGFNTPVATYNDVSAPSTTTFTSYVAESILDNQYVSKTTAVSTPVIETVPGNAPTSTVWYINDPYYIPGSEVLYWTSAPNVIIPEDDYEVIVNGDIVYFMLKSSVVSAVADDTLAVEYVRTVKDALPYFNWKEEEGDIVVEWSYSKGLSGEYHEANFAYEIARFCHEASVNDHEVLGVVGVMPPKSTSPRDIARWIGIAPTYDQYGRMTANGTGLLGNKHMVGTIEYAPGFYYTQSRYMDGIPVNDIDGNPIDLGKYISVVVGWGLMKNNYKGKVYGYFSSCEGVFAAVDEMLPPKISPTNKVLPLVVIPYVVSKTFADKLTKYGYTVVAYDRKIDSAYVIDAPTACNVNSDYKRRQTMKIVKFLNSSLRELLKPFIGGPMNTAIFESVKGNIESMFKSAMADGMINYYNFNLKATPRMQIQNYAEVHYTIVPAFELKQVYAYAALKIPTQTLGGTGTSQG